MLESGFPIFYRQQRVGQGGEPFDIIKLRSMRQDAEADGKARWATANDSRITRVGGFLRKTRIDELPQLWSVVRGDMSFVGPRPERQVFVEQLTEKIPFYDVRHSVKPGVTGWAQVRYPYGATIEDGLHKLQYDLYYVKNHSLFLDLMIMVETVQVVLLGYGAAAFAWTALAVLLMVRGSGRGLGRLLVAAVIIHAMWASVLALASAGVVMPFALPPFFEALRPFAWSTLLLWMLRARTQAMPVRLATVLAATIAMVGKIFIVNKKGKLC